MAYIALAALGLFLFLRARADLPLKLAAMVVTAAGVTTMDLPLVVLFKLYSYHPGLLPEPPDLYVGELLAEALAVPLAAGGILAAARPHRRWLAALLLGGGLVLVEALFLQMGIFGHDGWSLWYTALLFPVFLTGLGVWLTHFERNGYQGIHRGVILSGATVTTWTIWALSTGAIPQFWEARLHWFADLATDQATGALLLILLPMGLMAYAALGPGLLRTPRAVAAAFLALTAWVWFLSAKGILRVTHPIVLFLQAAGITGIVIGLARLDRWLHARRPA